MRLLLLIGLLLLVGCSAGVYPPGRGAAAPERQPLVVMSLNIRYDNPADGQHAWPNRRERVAQVIRFHDVHLVGAQEALDHQVAQLMEDLPGFAWTGVGRTDGKTGGEYSPIFYRTDRLELVEDGTFWLSTTPDDPGSRGWDAALPRIATWGRFRDRATGGMFFAINTHFDHVGEEARTQSARLISQRARELAGDLPIVMTGDFNAEPDSAAYATLSAAFLDARDLSQTGHFGPDGTFGTFEPRSEAARRIDFIFVGEGVEVVREATLAHHWESGHASDHWPVLAELVLPPP